MVEVLFLLLVIILNSQESYLVTTKVILQLLHLKYMPCSTMVCSVSQIEAPSMAIGAPCVPLHKAQPAISICELSKPEHHADGKEKNSMQGVNWICQEA